MEEKEEGAGGKATGGPEGGCRSSRDQSGAARTGTGAAVPSSQVWMSVGALNPEMSLEVGQ